MNPNKETIDKHIRILKWAVSHFENEYTTNNSQKGKQLYGVAIRAQHELRKLEALISNM